MNESSDVRKVIFFGEHFWEFYNSQTPKIKERINWTIKLIKTIERVPTKYLKNITGTTLYEMRMISGTNIYRIFCFFDKGKLVVVLNGFQKKTQKTPKNEIKLAEKLQNNITMSKTRIIEFDDHLNSEYGERGTESRETFEEGFEAFRLGVMLQELRKNKGLTQEQLARKCGTTKTYISRIEDNASDIRLSTLMRIVREGLGGHLRLKVEG